MTAADKIRVVLDGREIDPETIAQPSGLDYISAAIIAAAAQKGHRENQLRAVLDGKGGRHDVKT